MGKLIRIVIKSFELTKRFGQLMYVLLEKMENRSGLLPLGRLSLRLKQ